VQKAQEKGLREKPWTVKNLRTTDSGSSHKRKETEQILEPLKMSQEFESLETSEGLQSMDSTATAKSPVQRSTGSERNPNPMETDPRLRQTETSQRQVPEAYGVGCSRG
jgi:hypothetical protein